MSEQKKEALDAIAKVLDPLFPIRSQGLTLELADRTQATSEGQLSSGAVTDDGGSVWVRLRLQNANGEFEGGVWLMDSTKIDDPRRDAFVQGWAEALKQVLEFALPNGRHISLAGIDVRFPMDAVPGKTPNAFRSALLKEKWLGKYLPPQRRTTSTPYEKAPRAQVFRDGELDANALLSWINSQVTISWSDAKKDQQVLASIPESARALWFLFTFDNDVNSGGVESFLLQKSGWLVCGVREALHLVGSTQLLALLEKGIPLAGRANAEFARERGKGSAWWKSLALDGDASLSTLDGHEPGSSSSLLENELKAMIKNYAERNEQSLIAEA